VRDNARALYIFKTVNVFALSCPNVPTCAPKITHGLSDRYDTNDIKGLARMEGRCVVAHRVPRAPKGSQGKPLPDFKKTAKGRGQCFTPGCSVVSPTTALGPPRTLFRGPLFQ
jgi:hypothetical protein